MKDAHITIRLPSALADQLSARAAELDLPRSRVVREAVVEYLAGTRSALSPNKLTATEFVEAWRRMPHLTRDEAEAFGSDIDAAVRELPPVESAWDRVWD